MLLEKTYLPVINFIYDKTKWMSENTRRNILIICIVVEVLSTYVYQCDEFFGFLYYAIPNFIVGMICFVGIIITGCNHKIRDIKAKKWLIYLLMLCGAVIFISGLHHFITYSYMIMGFTICFVMPAFIIVWADNKNIDMLFNIVAWVLSVCFVVFIILNFLLAPVSNPMFSVMGRYFGMAADPNGLAKITVMASVCAIYMIVVQNGVRKIPFMCVLVVASAITFMTASRGNMIALILVLGAALAILIKAYIINKKLSARSIIVAACVVVLVGGMALFGPVLRDDGESTSTISNRLSQGVLEDGSIDLNVLSSGRIGIWKYCLSEASVIGHDMSNGIGLGEAAIYNDHVHNTTIELLHRSGVVAGISFLIIQLYCVIWSVKRVLAKRKNTSAEIMAVLLLIAYTIASIFDIVVLPFAKMTTFLFYLCMPVVFSKQLVVEESIVIENDR